MIFSPGPRWAVGLATLAVILLVSVADTFTGPDYALTLLYVVPVVAAGWWGGPFWGVTAAVAASVALTLANDVLVPDVRPLASIVWNAASRIVIFTVSSLLADRVNRNERELAARSDSLVRELRGREEYMSVLAHELRNPLVGIEAAARALASLPDAKARATAIASEARSGLSLIDGLTDVASIESGRLRSVLRPLDLSKLIVETVQARGLGGDRVDLRGSGMQLIVLGDERRLSQVVRNLVTNALKYTPVDSRIEIETGLSPDRRSAVTSVRDHGPGIPPTERGRLFEKFARLSTAGTTRGSGLGLYICREIIKDHNGELTADWPPDGGSVFTFTVPLAWPEVAPAR